MSAFRLMGKWSVPVATAVAVPLFGPAVFADSGSKDAAKTTTPTSRMIRPSELPMYEEPEEVLDFEYHGRERTSLEETVGSVRHEIEGILEATRSTREKVIHICETGKAHTMATVDMLKSLQSLQDEENMLPRVGAITIGGLAGLVLGARKKGGLAKKAMYTSVGVTATASLCYPRQAYQISQQAYGTAKEYANIGYNFVAGVKPQSKVAVPEEPKKEPPAEPIPEAEPSTSPETPPAETAPAESEGGEVRSVLPHAIPDEKFPGSVDSLAQQTSDAMQWGFRLTDKDSSAPSVPPADVVPPAKSSVPEGFGAVGEAESHCIVGAAEQVTVPKEPSQQTKETEAPDTIHEIVEKIAEDIAEKVGEDIVEDVAVVVKGVAEETLESVGEVAQMADLVENVTGRVSSTIDVIQDVLEAADKAAEEAGLPDTLIDVAEAVVEGVEIVVDTVNVVAGKIEEVAESVVKEIEDLKAEAVELVEDEGKREELVDKIMDYLSESTSPETADADQVKKPEEVSQEKDLDLKESQTEDMVTLPEPTVEVTEPVPSELEPVTEGTAPVVEITEPVIAVVEPVVEITEPVAEVTEPVVEIIEPVTVVAEPVVEITEPVAEVSEPVVEITEPVTAVAEPVVEITEPVIEVTEPVVEITEPVTEVTEPLVEIVGPITEKKEETTETIEQDVKQASESVEPEKDVSEVSAKSAPEEEAVSSGKEQIKPSIEDKVPVGVEKPSFLDNLLSLFRKDKGDKMIKEEAVVLPDKEEEGKPEPESLVAEEVLPMVEKLAEDIVKKAAEPVVEGVSKVVEEVSKEVEKEAEVIAETAEVVEKTGEEAAKCAEVIEGVAEAADKAAKDVPGVPEIVEEIAEKIDEVAKESEAVIDTVVAVAEKVEELAKEIVQEAKAIESAAAELVESEEKREELIENVIEFVSEKLSRDSPVEEVQSVVPETPVEAEKVVEGIEPTPLVEEM
ncbi:titin homolog isoform X5 [Macrobrachium nipponense]|uniref:titin homolog isoform X5 n=1 Tax=Macrobrachium nipponense TaxID=159736 RepID=UPI0030C810CA